MNKNDTTVSPIRIIAKAMRDIADYIREAFVNRRNKTAWNEHWNNLGKCLKKAPVLYFGGLTIFSWRIFVSNSWGKIKLAWYLRKAENRRKFRNYWVYTKSWTRLFLTPMF